MRRVLSALVLVLTLIFTTFGGIAGWPGQELYGAGGTFGGGSGTPADPYMIEDVYDLQAMSNDLTAYYALANDIDASNTTGWNDGRGFEPVGNGTRFLGGFDGRGHNIIGLYINRPGTDNVGLFGHVGDDTGATVIKNVHMVNSTVIGALRTGTLIGRVTGNKNTVIENCSAVDGNVIGDGATGGLIGYFSSWQITPGGADNPVLRYSYTNLALYSSASGGGRDKFGGLVGCSQRGTIQNSYSRSSVIVTDGSRIGGLAGCIDDRGEILNSYSAGLVSVTDCTSVGGLVGNSVGPGFNPGVVTHSFWDTETSGQATSAGGTGKNSAEMKMEATFTDVGWNFADIWDIDSGMNEGYPYVIWTGFVPAELTITGTFTANNKTYDGTNDATLNGNDLALSGTSGGDNVTLVDIVIRFSDAYAENNKTVDITSAALAGDDTAKYILSLVDAPTATARIMAKSVDPFITANDKLYDGTTIANLTTQGVSGVIGSDDVSLVVGAADFTDRNVGLNKTVTATGLSLAGAAAGNYALSAASATDTADITAKPVAPSITANDKVYDGATAATLSAQNVTGVIFSDDVSLVVGAANFTGKNVGLNKTVTATGLGLAGAAAGNYMLSAVNATDTADITQRPITITAHDKSKVYGEADPALTYNVTSGSLVAGDDFTGSLAREPGEAVGSYDILQGTLAIADGNNSSNYNLIFVWGTFTINVGTPRYALIISSSEGGSVTAPGEGIYTYDGGTLIALEAAPDAGYRFVAWSGIIDTIADVNAASTNITMNGHYGIKANFEVIPSNQYSLAISSTDGGSVTVPSEGTFVYEEGRLVNLVATPDTRYQFAKWSGDVAAIANVNAASTTITMNGDHTVRANFEAIPPPKYNLTISSTGGGSVVTPGEGTSAYYEGTVVNLVATPSIGYQFVNWSGDVSGVANPNAASTTITMNSSHSIYANFGAGACFIATAAYGTPMAEEIQVLRDFRDEYLLPDPVGRALVDTYYVVSPPLAEFITEHPGLKPIVRAGLSPAVAISSVAINTSPAEKATTVGLLVLFSVALTIWIMRRGARSA